MKLEPGTQLFIKTLYIPNYSPKNPFYIFRATSILTYTNTDCGLFLIKKSEIDESVIEKLEDHNIFGKYPTKLTFPHNTRNYTTEILNPIELYGKKVPKYLGNLNKKYFSKINIDDYLLITAAFDINSVIDINVFSKVRGLLIDKKLEEIFEDLIKSNKYKKLFLNLSNSESKNKVNILYIGLNLESRSIIYLTEDKLSKIHITLNNTYSTRIINFDEFLKEAIKKNCREATPGKFIKKITDSFSDKEVEEFNNYFLSKLENYIYKYDIIQGKDIIKWYDEENYCQEHQNSLQKSCMRYKNKQKELELYADNPEVCKMIILTLKGKLRGRALIWTDINGNSYIDRIYYSLETERNLIMNWAEKAGISRSYLGNSPSFGPNYKNLLSEDLLIVKIDKVKMRKMKSFPYTDSFLSCSRNFEYLIYKTRSYEKDLLIRHFNIFKYGEPVSISNSNIEYLSKEYQLFPEGVELLKNEVFAINSSKGKYEITNLENCDSGTTKFTIKKSLEEKIKDELPF